MNRIASRLALLAVIFCCTHPAAALVDGNLDGMSDLWTELYPGTAGQPDADPDHDGQTNFMEARAGTNPFSPTSRFVTKTTKDANGQVLVVWNDVPGKRYFVQQSNELVLDSWHPAEAWNEPALAGGVWTFETGFPQSQSMMMMMRVMGGGEEVTPVLEASVSPAASLRRAEAMRPPLVRYDVQIEVFDNGLASVQWIETEEAKASASLLASRLDGRASRPVAPMQRTYRLLTNLDLSFLPPDGVFRDRASGYEMGFTMREAPWFLFDLHFEISSRYNLNRVFGWSLSGLLRRDNAVRFYDTPFADLPHGGYSPLGAEQEEFLSWLRAFTEKRRDAIAEMQPAPPMMMMSFGARELAPSGDISTDFVFWRVVVEDLDSDGDGLSDWEEFQVGTSVTLADTDGDGMNDGWEYVHGFDPTDGNPANPAHFALADMDTDGLTNLDEARAGTNPGAVDSDNDGTTDGADAMPLNDAFHFPRLVRPTYLLVDLGPGTPLGVNDDGQVLIRRVTTSGNTSTTTYRVWSSGTNITLPANITWQKMLNGGVAVGGDPAGGAAAWNQPVAARATLTGNSATVQTLTFGQVLGLLPEVDDLYLPFTSAGGITFFMPNGDIYVSVSYRFADWYNEIQYEHNARAMVYWPVGGSPSIVNGAAGIRYDAKVGVLTSQGWTITLEAAEGHTRTFSGITTYNHIPQTYQPPAADPEHPEQLPPPITYTLSIATSEIQANQMRYNGHALPVGFAAQQFIPAGLGHPVITGSYFNPVEEQRKINVLFDAGTGLLPATFGPMAGDYAQLIAQFNRLGLGIVEDGQGGRKVLLNDQAEPLAALTVVPPASWATLTPQQVAPNSTLITASANVTVNGTTEEHAVAGVSMSLHVDADRNQQITFDQRDETSSSAPLRLWINNDVDRTGAVEAGLQDDDDPAKSIYATSKDYQLNSIPSERDLEDFFRLWIKVDHASYRERLKTGDIYLGLKWKNHGATNPGVKIYKAVEADGGVEYLRTSAVATAQLAAANNFVSWTGFAGALADNAGVALDRIVRPRGVGAAVDFVLPRTIFAELSATNAKTHLLFTGCTRGGGELQLLYLSRTPGNEYIVMGEGPSVHFDVKDIKEMYERWTVGEGNGSMTESETTSATSITPRTPAGTAVLSTARLPAGVSAPFAYPTPPPAAEKRYVLFVHSGNTPPWDRDAKAETMFKRLYWQGYKGRMGAFQWPTLYSSTGNIAAASFNASEFTALASGPALAALLTQLNQPQQYGQQVFVLAHGQGAMAAGEALRALGAPLSFGSPYVVNTYIASQAAVPVHAYDPSHATPADFFGTDRTVTGTTTVISGNLCAGPESPNAYSNWMTPGHAAVGVRVNFYNANDFALSRGIWETNQAMKPSQHSGIPLPLTANTVAAQPYGYSGNVTLPPTANGFYKTIYTVGAGGNVTVTGQHNLAFATGTPTPVNLLSSLEILAFATEARCRALGVTDTVAGFSSTVNLQSVWPADPLGGQNYSSAPWHAAQFRFTNMEQRDYWKTVLTSFGLPSAP